jgi:hypothetical protein
MFKKLKKKKFYLLLIPLILLSLNNILGGRESIYVKKLDDDIYDVVFTWTNGSDPLKQLVRRILFMDC